jgi:hypothetical protein
LQYSTTLIIATLFIFLFALQLSVIFVHKSNAIEEQDNLFNKICHVYFLTGAPEIINQNACNFNHIDCIETINHVLQCNSNSTKSIPDDLIFNGFNINTNTGISNEEKPKSSSSNEEKPKSSDDNTIGSKCGSSANSTFHWYCHGTPHHCLKGEKDCELFGGRASDDDKD